ncbi:hypothetical protein E1N52_27125 [Paraburkholderia guartelaensis]|uniref:Uncharacterized protein n=1 Tax=Paraburkholderia guartelaensis TaxID=2546446 RepID=A0A4R5LAG8_9BURK|nr:hypothetical protein [Paraburkholderia guartelaensis]TDG05110.1 hypothetical protein E1N52_27125 [Paraburkholderia guartelaensis]
MNDAAFVAIAAKITEEPRLHGATKAVRQAAYRARRTGLKVLEKAARAREFDDSVLEAAFARYGIRLVRSASAYSVVVDGGGLDVRRSIVKALRWYCRSRYVSAHNAARPCLKKEREERRAQLAAMGIDMTRFLAVCSVIDEVR